MTSTDVPLSAAAINQAGAAWRSGLILPALRNWLPDPGDGDAADLNCTAACPTLDDDSLPPLPAR